MSETIPTDPAEFASQYVELEQELNNLKVRQQEIELELAQLTCLMNDRAMAFRKDQMKEHLERIWPTPKTDYPY